MTEKPPIPPINPIYTNNKDMLHFYLFVLIIMSLIVMAITFLIIDIKKTDKQNKEKFMESCEQHEEYYKCVLQYKGI